VLASVARRYAPAAVAVLIGGAAAGVDALVPPDLHRAAALSARIDDAHGKLLRAFTTADGIWRLPVTPKQVSPLYLRMLMAYEDRRFRRHAGVDPRATARAAWQWASSGHIVSGGSTLTMQVARLLEPRPRTLWAKGIEMARALQLEAHYSKDRILAFYLTLAPFGGNLEGVRAASLSWFGKEPRHLTPGEAALLIALPQSPEGVRPDRFPKRARAARNKILRAMVRRGVLTSDRARAAMAEPIPTARRPLPFDAPHVARALHADAAQRRVVRTTIDRSLQRALAKLVAAEKPNIGDRSSIAVLVVDNKTRAIRAYVGSVDFFSVARAGHVDMVTAVRSPGSTLKPFIYGLAFDLKLAHPLTMVTDSPTRFGTGYRPENFERVYFGQVTARFALQNSLNVPAVAMLDAVGPVRFAAHLKAAGTPLRLSGDKKPGLPIALGGVGFTLHDLVTLYAGLANGGTVAPLRLVADAKPEGPTFRLVSPAAAWQLARILEQAPPPTDYVPARNARGGRAIAYKTGTSYGFRDAWAVGYDDRHTIGVWVGRPDGTPRPGHYGRNTAAPILFRVFDLLPGSDAGTRAAMPVKPAGVLDANSTGDLPANLRRLGGLPTARIRITAAERKPLAVTFPPNGALVELEPDGKGKPYLPLTAEGGEKPLRWLVNGRPVSSAEHRRQATWRADGEGFVRVTVIDATGKTASVVARVR
jgi:penicillin-binding protein 1C